MTSDVYYPHQRKRIENALQVGDCYVLANPEDPDHIFGYAVVEHLSAGDIVHFVYIKFPFRKMGLARKLFAQVVRDQATTLVSHTTANITTFGLNIRFCTFRTACRKQKHWPRLPIYAT